MQYQIPITLVLRRAGLYFLCKLISKTSFHILFLFWLLQSYSIHAASVCIDHFGNIPQNFNLSDYSVYRGDFDRDGKNSDYLLFGKEKFILIHGDIITPIVIKAATSIKLIKQNNGSYVREAAESICNGVRQAEYSKENIVSLLQSGSISEINSNNILNAHFNTDNREDFLLRDGDQALIFHWSDTGATQVSALNIPSQYSIVLSDINNDGRADIEVFDGSQFIRAYIANPQGYFSNPGDEDDSESKHITIERTWQRFKSAVSSGDHAASLNYLTPKFAGDFSNIIDVIGEEAGAVVDQIESIAPYYSDNKISVYLAKKRGDDGQIYIHTITFKASENGSWRIEGM